MKCQEVNNLLVAYLDNEVTPSERTLIQAHLAGCDTCQQELAALSALQSRVSQFLRLRAAQVTPSPQAWSRLQARLAKEARPSWFQRLALAVQRARQACQPREGMALAQRFVWALVAVLVIITGTMAFVPSIRAQVEKVIAQQFHFEVPGGRFIIKIPSPGVDFTPLRPTYLPAQLMCALEDEGKGQREGFRQVYAGKDWFVEIIQTRSSAERSLPTGWEVSINGHPGILKTGLQGKFEFTPSFAVKGSVCSSVYIYTDGKQLTWYTDDIQVVILSNLSDEEMLKIAQSMVP
ncbi:MAG: zf-HC2 domain-containing protein [Thermoflexales bacterium]|nr:zf-HC2 domain-containing protein [Thermoflexales bacterium]